MEKIKNFFKKIWSFKIVKLILLAFCVNLVCDILNQRSILDALVRLFTKPLNFIYNMLLIMSTIALCTLFKKRKFAILICLTLWLVIAIVNFIVQCFRNTPFSFMDLKLIPSVFSAFNSYLNLFEVILIIVLVCGLIVGFVFLFKKEGNKERLIKYSLITCAVIVCMLFITHVPLTKVGAISDDYSNLTAAYEEYGLPYCFVKSVISTGVDKVDDYNKEILDEVVDNIKIYEQQIEKNSNSEYTVDTEIKPNIIFLQLESFMDPNNIIDLNYSINPTPTFQYLKENYPSGTLKVPSVGAGTANVEFEIMTGFNLDHFAAGEYPYTSVVNKKTVESIGYLLKQEGYYNSIIHNNRATFYN